MGRHLEDTEFRRFLMRVRDAGIDIELNGNNLRVRGNPDAVAIYDEIKEYKEQIVHAMQNPPDGVDNYYKPRLSKGIEFMHDILNKLKRDPDNRKLHHSIVDKMFLGAQIDEEMRRVYPEYRGCPVDGCNFNEIPVRCVHCASKKVKELT